jgi:hypothetical protein
VREAEQSVVVAWYRNTMKATKETPGDGFMQNELTLEFPTKSMPSGFPAAAILDHRRPE